ncbi:hypothetical protein M2368_003576 [Arthrobacter sp. JUb119]|uniref:hypothetical protein n=1 Tax=Arthrobacter sp. JUb115 TaxID=2485108 RepID=UPI0010607074|nr:hypothetical protein [Arthrobacter sp. JUb115]MCS3494544.1 hypothetical protein [Arthrobacter sp. JUb119]TDU22634.1 hypothetical protein EDF61_109164 [Arthrobacter sp. JUb115]
MTEAVSKRRQCPAGTWISIALVLLSMLALVDWTNSGEAKPLWMFFLPILFGLIGSGIALAKRAYLWAVISIAFGVLSLQIMNVVITLLQGP